MYMVTIIIPVHNAGNYLSEALASILSQSWKESLEVSVFDDASTDQSTDILSSWKEKFEEENIGFVMSCNTSGKPGGVGYGKNKAVKQSNGKYLCFLDADDVMVNERIELQLKISLVNESAIVGCRYTRIPEGSTKRYTDWSNKLTEEQLYTQIYTSFGPTLINPTWFLPRDVYDKVGGFQEITCGFPEDLDFFYKHVNSGGRLIKIEKALLIYRYHEDCATFSVHQSTIWDLRIEHLQKNVLSKWSNFTIWNAGKQGRRFYRSLNEVNRNKVTSLCDVDEKKIRKGFYTCELIKDDVGKPLCVPIIHFTTAKPPFIICIKLDLTHGCFEKNLISLQLQEGVDYFHFS